VFRNVDFQYHLIEFVNHDAVQCLL
jgi:hypothetical protein